ncbi:MAG: type II/IV secretion system protein [Lentisphaeria bacterium]|nr:type II/IV secretion system protein [Lentisphaeria bacterium]
MLDTESMALIDLLLSELGASRPELKDQLKEVEEEHGRSGKPVFNIIENYGLFKRDELLNLIASSQGTYVWTDYDQADIPREIINKVDYDTARTYNVVPLGVDESGVLHLAMRNSLDFQTVESLQFILNTTIQPVVADMDVLETQLNRYYPEKTDNVHDILEVLKDSAEEEITNDKDLESMANEAPVVKFVDVVMQQAIRDKASDIHFEPFENEFRIRYRVDGALYEMPQPPKSLAVPLISRVKIISGLNISERRRPQDGRIELKVNGKPIDMRVSCLPTSYGESVVLRVLDRSVVNLDLDALGLEPTLLAKLREIIHLPNGILLVTGPTGSGKTTTLYSALREINVISDKLLTAEDPVEYDIEGIIQVPINDAVGMTFGKALRAFLRQDPDRILVGEIRDFETAQIAIEAALTGHFVFSTLHTNDAASTVTRLVDMGVEPFLICSSLSGILAQRLIRRICTECKTSYVPTDQDLKRLRIDRSEIGDHLFYYGKGCPVCHGTGYKGRKAICELLVVNQEIRDLIFAGAPHSEIREKAREHGMRTVREDGLQAIYNGETTVDEVVRYT